MSDQEAPLRNGVEHKIFEVLPFVDDDYGGVIVEMKTPMDTKNFVAALRDSFEQWRLQGKKGVWLNLPLSHVNLVEPAVKEGFRYHHAEPTYLMLVYWIPEAESTIPLNASHRVRVGAVVLNHNKEEKYGSLCGSGIWKIPTGVVDEGEEIFAAAIREVKEETGIDTEFLEILAFCQTHESFFAKSDLFFVCLSLETYLLRYSKTGLRDRSSSMDAVRGLCLSTYHTQERSLQRYSPHLLNENGEEL